MQVIKAVLGLSSGAVENGESVVGIVGEGIFLEQALELVASVLIVAGVKQRDGIVVLLLGTGEGEFPLLGLALTDRKIGAAALEELRRAVLAKFFEESACFIELTFLHELHGALVLRKRGVRSGFGKRSFLCGDATQGFHLRAFRSSLGHAGELS